MENSIWRKFGPVINEWDQKIGAVISSRFLFCDNHIFKEAYDFTGHKRKQTVNVHSRIFHLRSTNIKSHLDKKTPQNTQGLIQD